MPKMPSLVAFDELSFMRKHVNPNGLVVNLGIWHGRSLLRLCQTYGDKRVIGIDNFSWNDETSFERVVNDLSRLGHRPRIIEGLSESPPEWIKNVGVLFIDTLHTGDHLRKEVKAWLPRLREDVIVMLHDYTRFEEYQFTSTIDELFVDWNRLGLVRSMICFSR